MHGGFLGSSCLELGLASSKEGGHVLVVDFTGGAHELNPWNFNWVLWRESEAQAKSLILIQWVAEHLQINKDLSDVGVIQKVGDQRYTCKLDFFSKYAGFQVPDGASLAKIAISLLSRI